MKLARISIILFISLFGMASLAAADVTNEEFGVTVKAPEAWEVSQGNDKAVANFKHRGSQSQIEVVGTRLMTADVADVFFQTFHKTLKESNFEEVSSEEATYGDLRGKQTSYRFTHSGVTLEVVIFEFLRESTAWLVVGYMEDVEKDTYIGAFQSVVNSLTFKS